MTITYRDQQDRDLTPAEVDANFRHVLDRLVVYPQDFMTTAQKADVAAFTGAVSVAAAIQAAIDSIPSSGGTLKFPKGKYLVDAIVNLKSNLSIEGEGFGTVISLSGSTVYFYALGTSGAPLEYIHARNLHFSKPGASQNGIRCVWVNDSIFENITSEGPGTGNTGGGLVSQTDCARNTLKTIHSFDQGVGSSACFGIRIQDCIFQDIMGIGGDEVIDFSQAERCIVKGVLGKNNTDETLDFGNSQDCLIDGLVSVGSAIGISVKTEASGNLDTNRNVFKNVVVEEFTAHGLKFSRANEDYDINDNSFDGFTLVSSVASAVGVAVTQRTGSETDRNKFTQFHIDVDGNGFWDTNAGGHSNLLLSDSYVKSASGLAVFLSEGASSADAIVRNTYAHMGAADTTNRGAITVLTPGSTVIGCHVLSSGRHGILVQDASVISCVIDATQRNGIFSTYTSSSVGRGKFLCNNEIRSFSLLDANRDAISITESGSSDVENLQIIGNTASGQGRGLNFTGAFQDTTIALNNFADVASNKIVALPSGRYTFSQNMGMGPVQAVSADVGNTNKTLTATTHESTWIWNSALTEDRTVTLTTTTAYNGCKFRIVRTAASTGAFNLNVGTGPLAALATGEWCEVEFDGSAFVLTAFGALA